ncbi:MAG: D-proline reductase (dithiol) proprotein PrdA [Lachnospiraceae bacterium]|nr:D-proline reductase (dithiol) proprotein PrdA [Lachnospiraceae bacterium]
MSISAEYAQEHINDPAVLCCRREAGTKLSHHDFEDPAIFDDLVSSGLLKLDGAITIGQAMGATLTKTLDSLNPVLKDCVDKVQEAAAPAAATATPAAPASSNQGATTSVAGGKLKIHIGEGKGIDLEIPMGLAGGAGAAGTGASAGAAGVSSGAVASAGGEKVVRTLTRKHYNITEVKRGKETKIEGTTLYIRKGIEEEAVATQELVHDLKLDIITKDKYHTYSETIMDTQPIATKEGDSELGSGVTRVLDNVVMLLTGTTDEGVQIGEFGSSEGYLDENVMWGRPSCPDYGDILIRGTVKIENKKNMERPGPLAAHKAFDVITQEIRMALKELDDSLVVNTEKFEQVRRPGKKKVALVKEIMGQGAMHDNLILPVEPVGVLGAHPNVDLCNVPVVCSPLEVLDGCIHALTCIGPASKEQSRHYWREPMVLELLHDKEIDFAGVIFVGSPQINSEKFYVSRRVGMTCEAMDVEGAIVTTEGFGNNHVDFTSHIEQIGMRGIKVVGMSFCAKQGALVTGNKYIEAMVDNNKSEAGIENEILGNNTLCPEDAVRADLMLKALMAGESVKKPEKEWNPNVKSQNVELISNVTGKPVELVKNETSLPMSEKYKKKYANAK